MKRLSPSHSSSVDQVTVEAADKFSLFEAKTGSLDSSYEVPAGSDIEKVINSILLYNNGNGEVFDTKPIIYHSSFKNKKTQVDISKSEGDTFASILLDLATQLSAEIFYNAQGNLVVIPTQEVIGDRNKRCLFNFSELKGDYDQMAFSFDLTQIVNRVVVVGTSKNGNVYRAVAVNNDPASPLCYQRIGYRTGQLINDSNITTDYLAKERASYELRKQLILKSSVTLNVMFNPLLEVNNIVSITDEFYGLDNEKFLIQSISCPLNYSGTMSITLCNIQNLSFL